MSKLGVNAVLAAKSDHNAQPIGRVPLAHRKGRSVLSDCEDFRGAHVLAVLGFLHRDGGGCLAPGSGSGGSAWPNDLECVIGLEGERKGGLLSLVHSISVVGIDTAGNVSGIDLDVTVPHADDRTGQCGSCQSGHGRDRNTNLEKMTHENFIPPVWCRPTYIGPTLSCYRLNVTGSNGT